MMEAEPRLAIEAMPETVYAEPSPSPWTCRTKASTTCSMPRLSPSAGPNASPVEEAPAPASKRAQPANSYRIWDGSGRPRWRLEAVAESIRTLGASTNDSGLTTSQPAAVSAGFSASGSAVVTTGLALIPSPFLFISNLCFRSKPLTNSRTALPTTPGRLDASTLTVESTVPAFRS